MVDNVKPDDHKKPNDAAKPQSGAPEAASARQNLTEHAQDLMKNGATAADSSKANQATEAVKTTANIEAPKTSTAPSTAAADAAKPSTATDAPATPAVTPASTHSWLDIPGDIYSNLTSNSISSFVEKGYSNLSNMSLSSIVEKGWDKLSDSVNSTYQSILGDKANKTTHVEAKLGADGKPDYFLSESIDGTKTMSKDQMSFKTVDGGTVVKDKTTGEITSQSKDGTRILTRKADGTEIFRDGNVEYTRTKDGQYQIRNDKGDVTDVDPHSGAITTINRQFRAAQRLTNIADSKDLAQVGLIESFKDAQRTKTALGVTAIAHQNGDREFVLRDGQHVMIDHASHKLMVQENGSWRQMNDAELKRMHDCHEHSDARGRRSYQFADASVDADGKIKTADNVTLGENAPGGKMVAHIPTGDGGPPATLTVNADHTSDLSLHGHITEVHPDDPKNLVQGFKENPDGSKGASEYTYNGFDNSFNAGDLQWDASGNAHCDWNDCDINADGSVSYQGDTVWQDYAETQSYESSAQMTQQTCMEASSAVSSAIGRLGTGSADASDLGALSAASGDLDVALANAIATENFSAAVIISHAKAAVSTAIDEVNRQIAVKEQKEQERMKLEVAASTPAFSFLPDLTFG